jgi:hypothetical protein
MNKAVLPGDEAPCARRDRQLGSSTALEVLAATLRISLAPEELEWLAKELTEGAERQRWRSAVEEVAVVAAHREAREPEQQDEVPADIARNNTLRKRM